MGVGIEIMDGASLPVGYAAASPTLSPVVGVIECNYVNRSVRLGAPTVG